MAQTLSDRYKGSILGYFPIRQASSNSALNDSSEFPATAGRLKTSGSEDGRLDAALNIMGLNIAAVQLVLIGMTVHTAGLRSRQQCSQSRGTLIKARKRILQLTKRGDVQPCHHPWRGLS
jgi:hypothetical protein